MATQTSVELRARKYFQLSSQFAQLDNEQLHFLFEHSESHKSSSGWGNNHTIVLGNSQVFVKRLPVTDVEYNSLFSTKNLYHIPPSYNYGFGSPGFNVFRELVTHIKTTNWVLAGEISTFPLMYHYRIIPFSGTHGDVELEQWGNNENVRRYVQDKARSNYELILFMEYIPLILEAWLHSNPNTLQKFLNDLCTTIDFLRANGIIHFDAHFRNILTDGQQIYLADFGLALDKSFTLTKDEVTFFKQNLFYDYGEVLRNLGHLIRPIFEAFTEEKKRLIMSKFGMSEDLEPYQLRLMLLDNIEKIHADGDMVLDEFYVLSISKYRPIIQLMQDFFFNIVKDETKSVKLPHEKLERLLRETGFLGELPMPGD